MAMSFAFPINKFFFRLRKDLYIASLTLFDAAYVLYTYHNKLHSAVVGS